MPDETPNTIERGRQYVRLLQEQTFASGVQRDLFEQERAKAYNAMRIKFLELFPECREEAGQRTVRRELRGSARTSAILGEKKRGELCPDCGALYELVNFGSCYKCDTCGYTAPPVSEEIPRTQESPLAQPSQEREIPRESDMVNRSNWPAAERIGFRNPGVKEE